jgi:hypothetical protein
MKDSGLVKKILREIVFILAPVLLSLCLFPFLKNVPKFPFVTILGSLISLVLIVSVLLKADDKMLLVVRGVAIGVLYLFWLKGSSFGFEGFFWDNRYYALAVERFYHSFLPYSHEYKYIHFSLPPLLFFIIGRLGALFKITLPSLLKASSFIFVIYLPYLWGYGLKGIFKEKRWFAAFLLSLLVPFKTYETWYGSLGTIAQKSLHLTGIFLIIIWYLWVRRKPVPFWKAGLLAGVIFAFDYYPFMVIFIAILLEISGNFLVQKRFKDALDRLLYYTKIAGVVIGVNLIWIGPVILDLFRNNWGSSFNDWFDISGANIFNVIGLFNGFDLLSIVLIAGLINIFLNLSQSPEMKTIRTIFGALVAFLCLSYFLSFFKISFLFANTSLFIIYIFAIPSVFLFLHFGKKKSLAVIILIIITSISVLNQTEQNRGLSEYSLTSTRRYKISSGFREKHDFRDKIIFPYVNEIFYGEGAYSFISPVITYSDIAASFEDRLEYVNYLAGLIEEKKISDFYRGLKETPFGRVSSILLKKDRQTGDLYFDLMVYINDLKYPDKAGNRSVSFHFRPHDFSQPFFDKIYEDREFVVYAVE